METKMMEYLDIKMKEKYSIKKYPTLYYYKYILFKHIMKETSHLL